jgi:uncharacterized membrane protein YoaK (UPF0700 family)
MSSKLEFFVVLIGGLGLAFIAGYVNTLVIVLGAPPVTHLTGSISRLSADLSSNDYSDALSIGLIVLSFVVGAMIAGIIIGSSTLRLGRRYGVAIMLESALLALAAWTIPMSLVGGLLFAAAALRTSPVCSPTSDLSSDASSAARSAPTGRSCS